MKRKELIQSKLNEKETVDYTEIQQDDNRSMDRLIRDEEDKLYDVKKKIKKYQSNHTLTIGDDFVALIENKNEIDARIALLKQIKENYV